MNFSRTVRRFPFGKLLKIEGIYRSNVELSHNFSETLILRNNYGTRRAHRRARANIVSEDETNHLLLG
jgi:hypothetical protein